MRAIRPLAETTERAYASYFAHSLAAAFLPAGDNVPERRRGLGWMRGKPSLLTALRPEVIDAEATLRQARRASSHSFLRSDVGHYQKMADFCAKDGTIWTLAEYLVSLDQDAAKWLPRHWPEYEEVDRPGAACLTDAERVRAQCYMSRRHFLALADVAAKSPPSARFHRRLGELFRVHPHPLVGIFRLSLRLRSAQPEDQIEQYYNDLVSAYLALSSVRPLRVSETTEMQGAVVRETRDLTAFLLHLKKPKKNGQSYNNSLNAGLAVMVAGPLTPWIKPYAAARPPGASHYWAHPDGSPLTDEDLRYHLERVALTYAPDLLPFGLGAHDMRPIVASDLMARFGEHLGGLLAAEALRDAEWTVRDDYNCCTPAPATAPFDYMPEQAEAIEAAFEEALAAESARPPRAACET